MVKILKKFSDFYFSSYCEKFIENWRFLERKWLKMTITRKINIGKIWFFFRFSRFRIFSKFDYFWNFSHACKTMKRLLQNMPLTLTCSNYDPIIFKKKSSPWFKKKTFCIFHVNLNSFENINWKKKNFQKTFEPSQNTLASMAYQNNLFIVLHAWVRIHQNKENSQKWLKLHERCWIHWNERKIKFQIFPILFLELWSFLFQKLSIFN